MCKVIASIYLAPPLPFVLKGERVGGEGRAAACSKLPLRCTRFCATNASNSRGRIVPHRHYQPMRAPHPPTPSPLETKGEGETFALRVSQFELRYFMCKSIGDTLSCK